MTALQNVAYQIATGTFLTEAFTYEQYLQINPENYPLEDFEDWSEYSLNKKITGLAEEILERLEE